jgi:hypothetical protein
VNAVYGVSIAAATAASSGLAIMRRSEKQCVRRRRSFTNRAPAVGETVEVALERRDRDLDPQLVWSGKETQNSDKLSPCAIQLNNY